MVEITEVIEPLQPVAHTEFSSLLLQNLNQMLSEDSAPLETLDKSLPSSEVGTLVDQSLAISSPNAGNLISDDTRTLDEKQNPDESAFKWSNSYEPEEPMNIIPTGVGAGLLNLGNTCFINAILQCLTHTVPLVQLLGSFDLPLHCNCGNEGFCVLLNLGGHIKHALSSSGGCISPSTIVDNLNYFSSYFERYYQEDAHEFLQSFLDKLEKCCSDANKTNVVEQVFGGRLASRLQCCNCGACSITHEATVGLSLEIEDVDDLRSALICFTQVEKLEDEFTCDKCNEKVSKEKQLMLDQAPVVATFHLKRFKNDGIHTEKIYKHVEFPLELNLEPFMVSGQSDDGGLIYHLYAVVEHIGTSLTSGHYLSYIRSSPSTWHKLDDSLVTRVEEHNVLSQDAYILFYAREGTPWFSSISDLSNNETNTSSSSPKSVLDTAYGDYVSDHSVDNTDKSRLGLDNPPEVPTTGSEANENKAVDKQPLDVDWEFYLEDLGSDYSDILIAYNREEVHSVSEGMEKECSTSFGNETKSRKHDGTSVIPPDSSVSVEGLRVTDISPEQNQEGSYRIPVSHLKSEKQQEEASGKKSSSGRKVSEPLDRGIALHYLKKHTSSSRAKLLSAAMGGSSPVKRKKRAGKPSSEKKACIIGMGRET